SWSWSQTRQESWRRSVEDRHYHSIDEIIEEIKGKSIEELVKEEAAEGGPWLITVDELRAAGALDVPPAWRKSLAVEPDYFSGLVKDQDAGIEEQEPTGD